MLVDTTACFANRDMYGARREIQLGEFKLSPNLSPQLSGFSVGCLPLKIYIMMGTTLPKKYAFLDILSCSRHVPVRDQPSLSDSRTVP
jgi:hypothetical protein